MQGYNKKKKKKKKHSKQILTYFNIKKDENDIISPYNDMERGMAII